MDLRELAGQIKQGEWSDLMSPVDQMNVVKMSGDDIHEQLAASCGMAGGPVSMDGWLDIYWTAGWVGMMLASGLRPASTVAEIGSAISSNVIQAANALLGSRGRFVAINLNKKLAEGFMQRNRRLAIRARLVEDDGLHVDRHMPPAGCAFIAFNHQINDIVQTMLYEAEGEGTSDGNWYEMVPEMVRLVREAMDSGRMETEVRPQFLALIEACARVLAPGGCMGFNNAVTPMLLRFGYDEESLGSFIPLTRRWLAEDAPHLVEEAVEGFHPRWWMMLRKR